MSAIAKEQTTDELKEKVKLLMDGAKIEIAIYSNQSYNGEMEILSQAKAIEELLK
jgi:hypothetical protein